jgi:hypothetical protein
MLNRRNPSNASRKARHRAAFGRRLAVVGAASALSCTAMTASAAFSGPAGATTASRVACGDVYGTTGLVAAINAANAGAGGTISLAGGCTYTLTTPNDSSNGLPVVTSTVTINGNGSSIARSQAPGTADFRIFEVDAPGNLTLNMLTVTGGDTTGSAGFDGGGIYVAAFTNTAGLTLNNSQVVNNTADLGGGVFNGDSGTVRVSVSRLNNNTARVGGGLSNQGSATLSASQVNNNTVSGTARGGGIAGGGINNSGFLTASSTQVIGNTAVRSQPSTFSTSGGGLNNTGTLNLAASQVNNNTVSDTNGSAQGGGIFNSTGISTLRASTVTHNVATGSTPNGGGIFNSSGSVALIPGLVFGNGPNNCAPPNSVPGCSG